MRFFHIVLLGFFLMVLVFYVARVMILTSKKIRIKETDDEFMQMIRSVYPSRIYENDWEYRKRIFPEVYKKAGKNIAFSVLFGRGVNEVSEKERKIMESLPKDPNSEDLKKLAQSIADDPLIMPPE